MYGNLLQAVAAKAAAIACLAVAALGACAGRQPYVCAYRALVGGAVVYALCSFGGRMVASVEQRVEQERMRKQQDEDPFQHLQDSTRDGPNP